MPDSRKGSCKKYVKNLIKGNHFFYALYHGIFSCLLRFWGHFIRENDRLVLFVVYGGQRYDDSPRFVYEQMKKDPFFSDYTMVWAFINPDEVSEVKENKVRIDTLEYYRIALKAKYWITNSSASRGLTFMKKDTTNILFQHGMAGIKTLGADIPKGNQSFAGDTKERRDYIIIEGKEEIPILTRAWGVTKEAIYPIGLPRNDELYKCSNEKVKILKQNFNIPNDKKVILYAPTFRENHKDSKNTVYFNLPIHLDKWRTMLGENYVLLLAGHYEIDHISVEGYVDDFLVNCFKYPHINDLMLVSDILISDYSSIIFDYSILERPILSYAYDYEEYTKQRGVYAGYESIFYDGIQKTEEDLIRIIQNMDYAKECLFTKKYIKEKYILGEGNATSRFLELFKSEIIQKRN